MTKFLFIAATAAVALAAQACAQGAAPAQAQGEGGGRMQRDTTREQVQQTADMLFQRFDRNHDGVLTRQEAEQARTQMGAIGESGRGGRAERKIARLFGDQQSVTLAQAEAQALARFDAQDLNHDGVVTADERDQAREARQQGK
jgi:hypothetical protein